MSKRTIDSGRLFICLDNNGTPLFEGDLVMEVNEPKRVTMLTFGLYSVPYSDNCVYGFLVPNQCVKVDEIIDAPVK